MALTMAVTDTVIILLKPLNCVKIYCTFPLLNSYRCRRTCHIRFPPISTHRETA